MPLRTRAAGLREIGLPYATDPAITKHLAAFLKQAAMAMGAGGNSQSHIDDRLPMAKPDAVLFNGGFCIPAIARERITEAIANWFGAGGGWRPKILGNQVMSSAVAIGAAYYGHVRRGAGLRVRAGSAWTYYIGMPSEHGIKAVCVLPSGTNEGTTLPLLDREFSVLANRPVSFHLYSSTIRHDAHGAIADLDPEEVHRHAPLVTLLRYGKKLQQMELAVRLSVSFTEVGTLELWCESVSSPHRWRLQFEFGLGGILPETIPVGSVVQLRLAVPSHPKLLEVWAVVRSLREIHHGFEFVSMTECDRFTLRQFCDELAVEQAARNAES